MANSLFFFWLYGITIPGSCIDALTFPWCDWKDASGGFGLRPTDIRFPLGNCFLTLTFHPRCWPLDEKTSHKFTTTSRFHIITRRIDIANKISCANSRSFHLIIFYINSVIFQLTMLQSLEDLVQISEQLISLLTAMAISRAREGAAAAM